MTLYDYQVHRNLKEIHVQFKGSTAEELILFLDNMDMLYQAIAATTDIPAKELKNYRTHWFVGKDVRK